MLLATARSGRDSVRARLGRLIAFATALAMVAAGCSYHSSYVAPTDGRARVIWGASDTPTVDLAGVSLSPECSTELQNTLDPSHLPLRSHVEPHVHAVDFWVPRYYGPPILIVRPGFAPFLPRPPLFVPTLITPLNRPGNLAGGLGSISVGSGRVGGGGIRGGGSGSGLGSGGKEAGAVVLILLVIAATALPAIALGLAASTPESGRRTVSAIDLANSYNDLARSQGSPCAAPPPPPYGFVPSPPPPYGLAPPEPQP